MLNQKISLTPKQIQQRLNKSLTDAFSEAEAEQFLEKFGTGKGDYTSERDQLLGNPSLDEVITDDKFLAETAQILQYLDQNCFDKNQTKKKFKKNLIKHLRSFILEQRKGKIKKAYHNFPSDVSPDQLLAQKKMSVDLSYFSLSSLSEVEQKIQEVIDRKLSSSQLGKTFFNCLVIFLVFELSLYLQWPAQIMIAITVGSLAISSKFSDFLLDTHDLTKQKQLKKCVSILKNAQEIAKKRQN